MEDSDDGDDEPEDSEADLARRLVNALGAEADEQLFVTDNDELIILDERPVRPRLGGSGVDSLREAYLAQTRVKQERSPPVRSGQEERERRSSSGDRPIKTTTSTPRDGSPTGSRDGREVSEGSSDAVVAIDEMLKLFGVDSPPLSPSPSPQPQERTGLESQPRAHSLEPFDSQRNVSQKEVNSEPTDLPNSDREVPDFGNREFAFRHISPGSTLTDSGRRQPSTLGNPSRKRTSEELVSIALLPMLDSN